ncbi:DNA-directed RNA polymerase subunit omega [Pelagibacteraceae bacterium]|jgi:DNA-directed RNA polymerases I, II, and III subunit RPABC2|nr:DNA-directed RNA polymerase subunit omega [Pelagibacteraceae bacterium]
MDVDEYVLSENEDNVPSDIEDNDDMSVEPTKPVKAIPVQIDDNDIGDEEDNEDDDDESIIDSDIDEYGEEGILERDENNENVGPSKFTMDTYDTDDSEEDSDADDLQKFNNTDKNDIITKFHPELYNHNYDEIQTMAKVVRNATGTIVDPLHKTLPFITKYETARILGERAKQLNAGAQPFVEVDDNVIDGYLIALKEFEEKKIPFIIKRPLPNGGCEYWKVSDLVILV